MLATKRGRGIVRWKIIYHLKGHPNAFQLCEGWKDRNWVTTFNDIRFNLLAILK